MKFVLLTLVLVVMSVSAAFPDIPGAPVEEFEMTTSSSPHPVAELVGLYRMGDWEGLQAATQEVLESLDPNPKHEVNLSRHYYCVVLLDQGLDEKAELLRYLVHDPMPRPFEMRLPGIDQRSSIDFFEVLLGGFEKSEFKSRYSFKRKENPLLAKIPGLVQKFDNPLLEVFRPSLVKEVHATFHQMDIPFVRGTITVENAVYFKNNGKDAKAISKVTIDNVPPRKLAFGTLVGLVLSTDGATRSKVSDGMLVPDPISGVTTMALLNWHPWGFEEDIPWPYPREQARFFFGVVITPEFGLGGGFGFGLTRGLSINIGGGVLVVDELKEGETFGASPVDEEDPFQTAFPVFYFAGFGYDF